MRLASSHLHILLVLATGDAHGYRIMQRTAELTGGDVELRPGALYLALGRLVDAGLIVESGDRPAPDVDDQRRRYYAITDAGRLALAEEIAAMRRIVDVATPLVAGMEPS